MIIYQDHKTESDTEVDVLEVVSKEHELILYNDDVNTFDHVIDVLIRVCKHTPIQAEQCAIIVHFKGKCTVNHGALSFLKPRHDALLESGLSAEIQ